MWTGSKMLLNAVLNSETALQFRDTIFKILRVWQYRISSILSRSVQNIRLIECYLVPSSETQGQLVGVGKRLKFRNHLKSLPVIGHKNIFCAQSESSSFRVTFVTSYSSVFTVKLLAHLFYLLARAGEFPLIEKCH